MDSKTSTPHNVNLQWTFGLSKFFGVSVLHTTSFHKFYSILIQCLSLPCLVIWCKYSGVFESSLNSITKGILHVVTAYSSTILVLRGWKQTGQVVKAINILNSHNYEIGQSKIDKVLSCVTLLYFFALISIDLELDLLNTHYLIHLENCAYYIPLIQILMVSNQFMGLINHVELYLGYLLKQLKSSDRNDNSELMNNYNQLYEAAKLVNDAFSLQNLVLTIHHVFASTFALYYFFEALMQLYPTNTVRQRLWLSLATFVLYFSCVCVKFALCQRVQSKATDFKQTILDKIATDPIQVQLQAVRPLCKKIKFTAFEVVDIDFRALKAIVMTIVTYQVILLQFTVSSPADTASRNGSFAPQEINSNHRNCT